MTSEANTSPEGMVPVEEVDEQVRLMAKRMALLYYHMGKVLQEELGDDRARELIKKAIWQYGTEVGTTVREGVLDMDQPLTPENFGLVPDLPEYGWVSEEGELGPRVTYCPLADLWIEKGYQDVGRLYCYVDQAKYLAYNNVECKHLKNALDGDGVCLFSIKPAEE